MYSYAQSLLTAVSSSIRSDGGTGRKRAALGDVSSSNLGGIVEEEEEEEEENEEDEGGASFISSVNTSRFSQGSKNVAPGSLPAPTAGAKRRALLGALRLCPASDLVSVMSSLKLSDVSLAALSLSSHVARELEALHLPQVREGVEERADNAPSNLVVFQLLPLPSQPSRTLTELAKMQPADVAADLWRNQKARASRSGGLGRFCGLLVELASADEALMKAVVKEVVGDGKCRTLLSVCEVLVKGELGKKQVTEVKALVKKLGKELARDLQERGKGGAGEMSAVERFSRLVGDLGEFEGGGADWSEAAASLCDAGWVEEAVAVAVEIRCRGDKRAEIWGRIKEQEGGAKALKIWLGDGNDGEEEEQEEEVVVVALGQDVGEEEDVRKEIRKALVL